MGSCGLFRPKKVAIDANTEKEQQHEKRLTGTNSFGGAGERSRKPGREEGGLRPRKEWALWSGLWGDDNFHRTRLGGGGRSRNKPETEDYQTEIFARGRVCRYKRERPAPLQCGKKNLLIKVIKGDRKSCRALPALQERLMLILF